MYRNNRYDFAGWRFIAGYTATDNCTPSMSLRAAGTPESTRNGNEHVCRHSG
ncbi:hypothetical protein J7355_01030 [Endozoicomonas sp. G2_2]|uniref:hypothetical protein n=1 Tax=Endozoicomonas sp. G2_2 TaxID=2821092 RepID=UPI001ADBB5B3|nr:hypothetical protein [Endozoicomonas sp. G2_2]MBO9468671.1 hypothetical protein [Endozoicomonas sp. G2_2]